MIEIELEKFIGASGAAARAAAVAVSAAANDLRLMRLIEAQMDAAFEAAVLHPVDERSPVEKARDASRDDLARARRESRWPLYRR